MQSSRDSSLWRSLAAAFGDGLAFAVGVKLTQAAGHQLRSPRPRVPAAGPQARSSPTALTDRTEGVEGTLVTDTGVVNQKVLEAIMEALEARLVENSAQMERRLASLEGRLAVELRSLDQQDHSIAKRVSEEIGALRQMVGLHRKFGETVARIIAEQVGSHVEARAAAWEQSMAARVATAAKAAMAPLEQRFRAEVEQRDREIAELRQRLADTDAKVLELILGIGQICRQAADRIGPAAGPQDRDSGRRQSASPAGNTGPEGGTGGAEASGQFADLSIVPREGAVAARQPGEPEEGTDVAQAENSNRLWKAALVSSLVFATSGLMLRHFL